jgi:hypothetical protein
MKAEATLSTDEKLRRFMLVPSSFGNVDAELHAILPKYSRSFVDSYLKKIYFNFDIVHSIPEVPSLIGTMNKFAPIYHKEASLYPKLVGCLSYAMERLGLSPDKFKIKCSFSPAGQAYQEGMAIVEVDANSSARLFIELKATVSAAINRIDLPYLKELLLYANYFMRKDSSQEIVACITDANHFHIFKCVISDDIRLEIVKCSSFHAPVTKR